MKSLPYWFQNLLSIGDSAYLHVDNQHYKVGAVPFEGNSVDKDLCYDNKPLTGHDIDNFKEASGDLWTRK